MCFRSVSLKLAEDKILPMPIGAGRRLRQDVIAVNILDEIDRWPDGANGTPVLSSSVSSLAIQDRLHLLSELRDVPKLVESMHAWQRRPPLVYTLPGIESTHLHKYTHIT